MNIQQLIESSNQAKVIFDDAKRLSSKWAKSGLLEGLKGETDRNTMAMLLENQAKQLVTEVSATGTAAGGAGTYNGESWNGVALPLVRRVFGELSSKEFVSVQPMNLPSGLVFYLDFKYGTGVQPFVNGGSLYGANTGTNVTDITSESLYGAGQFGYSSNQFSSSALTVATSSVSPADVNFDSSISGSAATTTLKKILVTVTSATGSWDPNAIRSFAISGSSTGTIFSGDILSQFTKTTGSQVQFIVTGSSAASATISGNTTLFFSVATTTQNRGDFEDQSTGTGAGNGGNGGYPNAQSNTTIAIPEINVQLKSEAIVAKTRKLKAQWTPEFAQDLNAYHSVDAEAELTGILSQYISMEIDLEIQEMLLANAYTVDYWSAQNNTTWNGSGFTVTSAAGAGFYNTQGGWFQTIGTKMQKVSNKIHQLTLRGGANFILTSPTVSTILESIPGFAADGDGEKMEYNFGIQKIGSLNSRYKVYKNPYMTENVILMGYKGAQFLECGAVFAPYVPLIMTPLLYDPSTFTPRKGLMTRYAKKMIRPDYYAKIYVAGLETI
jgi:hypothetical protein